MSNRPGLGAYAIPWLADQHRTRLGARELVNQGDVFTSIRLYGKIWPLGQYLRKKLRDELGVPQSALERSNHFGRVYKPEPDEWAGPLEDYCPFADLAEQPFWANRVRDDKAKEKEIPEVRKKADHRARKTKRRKAQTLHI